MKLSCQLRADFYLFLRSPLLAVHLGVPAVGVLFFVWYASFSPWEELDILSAYLQALSISFPFLIGLTTSLFSVREGRAGHFQRLLTVPAPKLLPHLSNLLLLIFEGLCSSLLALLGFEAGFHLVGHTPFPIPFYMETAFLLWVSVLPLYPLHDVISFRLGKTASLGLGILGSLLSALFLTGLGDGIWSYLPWGIAARFSESFLVAQVKDLDFFLLPDMIQGMVFLFIFAVLSSLLFLLSLGHWEGKQPEQE